MLRGSREMRLQQGLQMWPGRFRLDIGGEVLAQFVGKRERPFFGVGLDEEVERIDDFEIGEKSTVTENSVVFSGKTKRAIQLPCGSCCQFTKCCFGVTFSE